MLMTPKQTLACIVACESEPHHFMCCNTDDYTVIGNVAEDIYWTLQSVAIMADLMTTGFTLNMWPNASSFEAPDVWNNL